MRANETYLKVKGHFSVRNRDVLMNGRFPHKWWSTLKSAVCEMGLIPATADHNPELLVYRSLDHMYSCKMLFLYALCNCMFLKINLI